REQDARRGLFGDRRVARQVYREGHAGRRQRSHGVDARAENVVRLRALAAGIDVGAEAFGLRATECAVIGRGEQIVDVPGGHQACPSATGKITVEARRVVASIARARLRRDLTVPTGMRSASAISSYDRSLTSRSTTAARKSGGNAFNASRTAASRSRARALASGPSPGS